MAIHRQMGRRIEVLTGHFPDKLEPVMRALAKWRILMLAVGFFSFCLLAPWGVPGVAGAALPECGGALGSPQPAAALVAGVQPVEAPPGEVSVLINLDTRTITVFSDGIPFRTFPVAVGKSSTPSPLGEWTIAHKGGNWGSGFGTRWLGLSVPWGIYGIHGTNKPGSIGSYASHGCFRMFNQDVEQLYSWVRVGTPVGVIGTPSRLELYAGNKGFQVLEVQARLRELGLYQGKVDGIFGPDLARAVARFQKAQGLKPDGNVGPAVYRALGLIPAPVYRHPLVPDGWSG